MIRRTIALATFALGAASASLLPARLAAQTFSGCGLYICLSFQLPAGGATLSLTQERLLPAYDALGASDYGWWQPFSVGVSFPCGPNGQRCGDGGRVTFSRDIPSITIGVADGTPGVVFSAFLDGPASFVAYDDRRNAVAFDTFELTTSPEPATLALVGGGVLLLGAWARRKA